jgi:excisionase family DNA binding protein
MQLVSIKTIADLLSVKQSTLYSWVHNGTIPFHKLNGLIRFDIDEIEAWIKAARHQPSLSFHCREVIHQDIDKFVRSAIPRLGSPKKAGAKKRLLAQADSKRECAVLGGRVSESRQDGTAEVAPLASNKAKEYNRIQRETRPNTRSQKEG